MRLPPLFIQIRLLLRYLGFYRQAKTKYDIDSPFVSSFIQEIIEDKRSFYAFSLIQWLRRQLRQDKRVLQIKDHGAGSLIARSNTRSVRHIAQHGAISDRQGRYLFRMAHFYHPPIILELGTSLGISSLYLALADSRQQLITVEGSPDIAERAAETFFQLRIPNVSLIQDTFDQAIAEISKKNLRLGLVYLDGDHRKGSSLRYFKQLLPLLEDTSILVIADIYWSREMQVAWKEIKQHPRVSVAIDLFDFGVLFFDPGMREKLDLKVVPAKYKPWRIGLFR
jgi:predicted O-methyltransferase YrrM